MTFTKDQMQAELLKFLMSFGKQASCLYRIPDEWLTEETVRASPVWLSANEMYDYGIAGIPPSGVEAGVLVARHQWIEKFLFALDSSAMRIFLNDDGICPPELAILTAKIASARMVLEGRSRYTDLATEALGPGNGNYDHLTIAEIALLANMDERSVRNAANPKLPDPLRTTQVGRRSLVEREEAKRWLAGRKGFVPTQGAYIDPGRDLPSFNITFPVEFVRAVEKEAKKLGVPFSVNLERHWREHVKKFAEKDLAEENRK